MKKIGLFGGTFDPIHIGHIRALIESFEQLKLDYILVIPNYLPPHKKVKNFAGEHRIRMLELAIKDLNFCKLSFIEYERKRPVYTVETIKMLKKRYKEAEFFLIIGEDSLRDFHTWYKPEEIKKLVNIAVYPRLKNSIKLLYKDVYWIEGPLITVSSTEIKEKVKNKLSIFGLVPFLVEDYIIKNKIYVDEK